MSPKALNLVGLWLTLVGPGLLFFYGLPLKKVGDMILWGPLAMNPANLREAVWQRIADRFQRRTQFLNRLGFALVTIGTGATDHCPLSKLGDRSVVAPPAISSLRNMRALTRCLLLEVASESLGVKPEKTTVMKRWLKTACVSAIVSVSDRFGEAATALSDSGHNIG